MSEVLERSIALLKRLLPDHEPVPKREGSYVSVILPTADKADYGFEIGIHDDGEPQIIARLVRTPERDFWYYPFEDPDFESAVARDRKFVDTLGQLLTHTSRVRHHCGFLFDSFTCELRRDATWKRLGPSVATVRWKLRVPKRAEYTSPRISGTKAGAGRLTSE